MQRSVSEPAQYLSVHQSLASTIASSLLAVGSGLKSVGASVGKTVAAGCAQINANNPEVEKVYFVKFAKVEYMLVVDEGDWSDDAPAPHRVRVPVLLLVYGAGFQIWSLEDSTHPRELVSKRDQPIR